MEELRRIKKVINWLIFTEVGNSEREIAERLGYTKSGFSQIVNGKVGLSDKFIGKLCGLDTNINLVWVQTGEGRMFIENNPNSEEITLSLRAWQVIEKQADSLAARDAQISDLIALLREQLAEMKKMAARGDDPAASADAV